MKRYLLLVIIFLIVFNALFFSVNNVQAAGLVPCGGYETDGAAEPACNLCYFLKMLQGLITWGRNVVTILALVGFFIAGVMYILSSGNENMMNASKGFMKSVIIGFAVFWAAWLIVNITIVWVLGADVVAITGRGEWFSINCEVPQGAGEGYLPMP